MSAVDRLDPNRDVQKVRSTQPVGARLPVPAKLQDQLLLVKADKSVSRCIERSRMRTKQIQGPLHQFDKLIF
jgi:hypothetical protein